MYVQRVFIIDNSAIKTYTVNINQRRAVPDYYFVWSTIVRRNFGGFVVATIRSSLRFVSYNMRTIIIYGRFVIEYLNNYNLWANLPPLAFVPCRALGQTRVIARHLQHLHLCVRTLVFTRSHERERWLVANTFLCFG